jgi:hypothetical protein
METIEKGKTKNIMLKAEKITCQATAIETPTHDIALSFNIKYKLKNSEVGNEEKKINAIIKNWYEESMILMPGHCIVNLDTPTYLHSRKMSMVFRLNISVTTKKEVQSGTTSFKSIFGDSLDGLFQELSDLVEAAGE